MNLEEKYFELCYTERINEFSKIDILKGYYSGDAKKLYKRIDDFYLNELNINEEELLQLRGNFKQIDDFYSKYFNKNRKQLFENYFEFTEWYEEQNDSCNYCGITQVELLQIVSKRNGNLTLNQRTKRSKGSLEIEKFDPSKGYSFENSVLACPFCNNAKSNLISEEDWRRYFVPSMKQFLNKLLSE